MATLENLPLSGCYHSGNLESLPLSGSYPSGNLESPLLSGSYPTGNSLKYSAVRELPYTGNSGKSSAVRELPYWQLWKVRASSNRMFRNLIYERRPYGKIEKKVLNNCTLLYMSSICLQKTQTFC